MIFVIASNLLINISANFFKRAMHESFWSSVVKVCGSENIRIGVKKRTVPLFLF